jgi:hypothetical protein
LKQQIIEFGQTVFLVLYERWLKRFFNRNLNDGFVNTRSHPGRKKRKRGEEKKIETKKKSINECNHKSKNNDIITINKQ